MWANAYYILHVTSFKFITLDHYSNNLSLMQLSSYANGEPKDWKKLYGWMPVICLAISDYDWNEGVLIQVHQIKQIFLIRIWQISSWKMILNTFKNVHNRYCCSYITTTKKDVK